MIKMSSKSVKKQDGSKLLLHFGDFGDFGPLRILTIPPGPQSPEDTTDNTLLFKQNRFGHFLL